MEKQLLVLDKEIELLKNNIEAILCFLLDSGISSDTQVAIIVPAEKFKRLYCFILKP